MRQKENRHKRLGTKKISGIGLMIALAFVLSYIESMIPINIGIPGIKAGFSNIVVIFAMYVYGPFTAFSNRQDNTCRIYIRKSCKSYV